MNEAKAGKSVVYLSAGFAEIRPLHGVGATVEHFSCAVLERSSGHSVAIIEAT